MVEQSENRSPSCPFEAAPSASAVVYRDPTQSRHDFSVPVFGKNLRVRAAPAVQRHYVASRLNLAQPLLKSGLFRRPSREPISWPPSHRAATAHRWPSISNHCFAFHCCLQQRSILEIKRLTATPSASRRATICTCYCGTSQRRREASPMSPCGISTSRRTPTHPRRIAHHSAGSSSTHKRAVRHHRPKEFVLFGILSISQVK
jgi:hypothetical protein